MYYLDLTSYRGDYLGNYKDALNVGWLDNQLNYNKGDVSKEFLDGLLFACKFLYINKSRSAIPCLLCNSDDVIRIYKGWRRIWLGTAEIKVTASNGKTYISPDLIFHYVEKHNYQPPQEFIDAICRIERHKLLKLNIFLNYYGNIFWNFLKEVGKEMVRR
jgi:hypothetical protein